MLNFGLIVSKPVSVSLMYLVFLRLSFFFLMFVLLCFFHFVLLVCFVFLTMGDGYDARGGGGRGGDRPLPQPGVRSVDT